MNATNENTTMTATENFDLFEEGIFENTFKMIDKEARNALLEPSKMDSYIDDIDRVYSDADLSDTPTNPLTPDEKALIADALTAEILLRMEEEAEEEE